MFSDFIILLDISKYYLKSLLAENLKYISMIFIIVFLCLKIEKRIFTIQYKVFEQKIS